MSRLRHGSLLGGALLFALSCRTAPAAPKTLSVLPLGDSITQGRGPGPAKTREPTQSYRYPLFRALLAQHAAVDLVGGLRGGFEDDPDWPSAGGIPFDGDHQARWGARLDEVLTLLRRDLPRFEVDVALILLGANDLDQGETIDSLWPEWEELLSLLRAKNPHIGIALGVYCGDWGELPHYRSALHARTEQLSTKTSKVIIADPCEQWTSDPKNPHSDTVDWVHPNARGDQKIADAFLHALTQLAPQHFTQPPP